MKNILKKQILWAIPLAFSLLTSSCSDYLDKLPENTVEVEGIDYTNKSNMYMPVSGVYATARGYLGSWSSYGCIIVRGDDVNKGCLLYTSTARGPKSYSDTGAQWRGYRIT